MKCPRCGNDAAYKLFTINKTLYCDKCGQEFLKGNLTKTRIYRPQTILGTGGKRNV